MLGALPNTIIKLKPPKMNRTLNKIPNAKKNVNAGIHSLPKKNGKKGFVKTKIPAIN